MKRLKNWYSRQFGKMKSNDKDERLKRVEVDGVVFYVFSDPRLLPYPRNQVYSFALTDYAEKLAHSDILEYTKQMREVLNAGNLADAAELNGYLESILLLDNYQKPHFKIAGATILLENEPTNEIVQSFQKRKEELCRSSKLIDSFFLHTGISLCGTINSALDFTKLSAYLESPTVQNIEKAFLGKLGKTKWSGFYRD